MTTVHRPRLVVIVVVLSNLLTVVAFAVAGWSFYAATQRGDQNRRELCQTDNNTRRGVRQLVDLAFAPGLAKLKPGTDAYKDAVSFREQLKQPVRRIPCDVVGQ
jgi:hypothetical protein